jgi:hypothetical protein
MAADIGEIVWYTKDSAPPLTVSKPSLFASGQILLAVIAEHSGNISDFNTGPTGWTKQGTYDSSATQGCVWSHVFDGTEPATWDFNFGSVADTCLALVRIIGGNVTAPVISVASSTFTSIASSTSAPTITPSSSDDLLLCFLANICNGTVLSEVDPAGMLDLGQAQIAGNFMALAGAYESLTASGATGVRTFTSITPTGVAGATFSITVLSGPPGEPGSTSPTAKQLQWYPTR